MDLRGTYIVVICLFLQNFYRVISQETGRNSPVKVTETGTGLLKVADCFLKGWTNRLSAKSSPILSQLLLDFKTGVIFINKANYCDLKRQYTHVEIESLSLKESIVLIRKIPFYSYRDDSIVKCNEGPERTNQAKQVISATLLLPEKLTTESTLLDLRHLMSIKSDIDNIQFSLKFEPCVWSNDTYMDNVLHIDQDLAESARKCSSQNKSFLQFYSVFKNEIIKTLNLKILLHPDHVMKRTRRNVEEPAFPKGYYVMPVRENTKIGSIITTIKVVPNSAPGYTIAYSIEPSNVGFSIDQNMGEVKLTRELDYEAKTRYNLWVRTSFAFTRLVITVLDVNDNAPIFEHNPYTRTISESVISTASILEVKATDKDTGANGDVRYSLLNAGGANSAFDIDEYTGQIFLANTRLDREKTARYELTVKAEDQGVRKLSSETKVIIIVSDVNDNSPVFSKPQYTYSMSEKTAVGAKLLKVTATDADEGTNSKLSYVIVNDYTNPAISKFDMNRLTGEISLKQKLDYEDERERNIRFTVEAQDSGIPAKKGSAFISITLTDDNDNVPIFRSHCAEYVFEDTAIGDTVCTVSASDRDASAPNNEVVYSLENPPKNLPFMVDFSTGQIKVSAPLDYDNPNTRKFSFTVKATDKGNPPKSSTSIARITLKNINDNYPKFSKPHYETAIAETTQPGRSVLELSATDIDQPRSNEFQYSIVRGNEKNCFSILSNRIYVHCNLNYDIDKLFNLTVQVRDSGALGRQLSTQTYVVIRISDANTHPPLFRQTSQNPSVREDAKIGTFVFNVSATDLDSGENGRISYSLINSDGFFKINSVTGEVRTLQKLDSERIPSHELRVVARDHGSPIKSSVHQWTIAVIDINDNKPIFQRAVYRLNVKESVEIGKSLLRVRATDSDSGSSNRDIVYSMSKDHNGNGTFYIKTEGYYGTVRNSKKLDREKIDKYELLIFATDKGVPPLNSSAKIQITVEDVMDSPPVFDKKVYNITLNENYPSGKVFVQVRATTADANRNMEISYLINRGSGGSDFTIDGINGEISLKQGRVFDFEKKQKYRFSITAYYGTTGLEDTTTVLVNLIDLNDNAPVLRPFSVYVNFFQDNFPKAATFKIPASDKDANSALTYEISGGDGQAYVTLNSKTGNLTFNTNIENIRSEVNINVDVTDGKFTTTGRGSIIATRVSSDMVKNLIRLVLNDVTVDAFLASDNIKLFKNVFADAVGCNKRLVYVVGVKKYMSLLTPDKAPKIQISVAARFKADGEFLTPQHIKDHLYLNKVQFVKALGKELVNFDDGDELWCSQETCLNYQDCKMLVNYPVMLGKDIRPQITETTIFWGIYPTIRHSCQCPNGYRDLVSQGRLKKCGASYSLCYSNPCKANGQCVSTGQGYACKCKKGYAGKNCEIDMNLQTCPSGSAGICENNGVCAADLTNSMLKCVCTVQRVAHTNRCQLTTRHFAAGAYLSFPGLVNRWKLSVSMEFKTHSVNGILFYNGRYSEKRDFIAIRINGGQVELVFSLGENPVVVRSYVSGGVSDGLWHTVNVVYENKIGSIAVGKDCDIKMATLTNSNAGRRYCAASKASTGGTRSLDLTAPFHIGGHPSLGFSMRIPNEDFNGCIRSVFVDHVLLDLEKPLKENNTTRGCPVSKDYCNKSPCVKGFCVSLSDGYRCDCEDGFVGKHCETDVKLISPTCRFGNSAIMTPNKLSFKLTPADSALVTEMTIRTRQTDSVLMHQQINGQNAFLKVVAGSLKYFCGAKEMANLSSAFLSDGKWHHVKVRLDAREIQLSQDYGRHHITTTHLLKIDQKPVNFLSFGGVKQGQTVSQGFLGCLQGLYVDAGYLKVEGPKIIPGCQSKERCGGCGTGSCSGIWDKDVCSCDKGYTGPNCIDVCQLKPCLNEGICHRSSTATHGFICSCKPSFTGLRCETKMSTSCDDGYYGVPGSGQCGPCNCDVGRSFDPTCNKTSGMCFCKAGYYRVGDTCQPCNCLAEGTINNECDRMTGQCRCKPRVIGLNCDRCMGAFQAILSNCKEINTSCPESFSENIWWSKVDLGQTKVQKCPSGTTGNATRFCHPKRGWQKAQMNLCTTNEFNQARKMLKNIAEKKTTMTKKLATELATSLEYALSTGKALYENDIRIGYNAISEIIEYEANHTRFDLISSSDGKFIKNIVAATSRLVGMDSKSIWTSIQQVDAGTVGLMQKMEKLLAVMTENFSYVRRRQKRSVTTLSPYGFASANLLMEFQQVNVEEASLARFPLEKSAWIENFPSWHKSKPKIHIPTAVFNKTYAENTEATVGLLLYKTLGDLLPSKYFDERTKKIYNVEMYSDVLTLTIPGIDNQTLQDNITMVFHNKKNNLSTGLHCVFWNYTSMSSNLGGWSKQGCDLVPTNGTTITCQCNHLTSFSVVRFVEILPAKTSAFTVPALTYITISVSMGLLLFTFITYICLSQLRSNSNSIHKNLCAALFLAELVFAVGINRTGDETVCRIIAILLHYFFSCVFSWMLVEAFHMYRMLVEQRNINYEQMTFYYSIGWGAPVIVVGVTAGLSPEGYGNDRFCWISTQGQLLWTFTAPIMAMVAANLLLFVMAAFAYCKRRVTAKEARNRSRIRFAIVVSAILLPLLCLTFVAGLLAVNIELGTFSLLFSGFILVPGLYVILFHVIFNKEVRDEFKNAYIRWKTGDPSYGKKKPRVKRTLLVDSSYRSQLAQLTTTFNLSTSTTDSSTTDGGRGFAKRRKEERDNLPSSTQPDSSDTSDEETNPGTNVSDSSDSSDDDDIGVPLPINKIAKGQINSTMSPNSSRSSNSTKPPSGARSPAGARSPTNSKERATGATSPPMNGSRTPDWKVASQKKLRTAPLYASDGPMHSTPSDNSDNSEKRSKKKWPQQDEKNPVLDLTEVTVVSEDQDGPEDPLLSSLRKNRPEHSSSSDTSEVSSLPSVIRVGPGGRPQSILKKTSKYGSATDSDSERRGKVRVRISDKQKRPLLKIERENPDFQDSQV